jgi:redox-sensitive bicupin YhaK (pirin superfamily)
MSDLLPDLHARSASPAPDRDAPLQQLPSHQVRLGDLAIRRVLPVRERRVIGPWCFFDRFGPLTFTSGKPMDVAPHPHLGLQTVSWLLEGEIVHHDSLGYEGLLRPGQLNLMTAGRGIAHAEETPPHHSNLLNGVQLWVALPDVSRNLDPSFQHLPSLPSIDLPGGRVTLIVGTLGGVSSEAKTYSPLVGADVVVDAVRELHVPLQPGFEHAVLVTAGEVALDGEPLARETLYYLGLGRGEIGLASRRGARLLLIGGAPFGERLVMWWNFVARSADEIEQARRDWIEHKRFDDVTAYRGPRVEAPPLLVRPLPSC